MYLRNRMNAIDVIYNKSSEVYPSCEKKSEVLERDSLRYTGLNWLMMRHKEISGGISYVIHLHHGYESKAKAFRGPIFVNMIQ